MKSRLPALFALVAFALSSCAIAPIQSNVTQVTTAQIARRIRCETRDALRGQLAGYLLALNDTESDRVGKELENRNIQLENIDFRGLRKEIREYIAGFRNYAVTYDFSLDGAVTNDLGGGVTATNTYNSGNSSFPFTASLNRSRQNIQTFRLTDTFGELLREIPKEYCNRKLSDDQPNYIYPIAGRIGIAEQLRTFLSLGTFGNLAPPEGSDSASFASQIKFTTALSGSVKPAFMITPVLNEITRSGNFDLSASRTDIHTVTVGFAASDIKPTANEIALLLTAPENAEQSRTARRASQDAVDGSILRNTFGRDAVPIIINRSLLPSF